MTVQQKERKKKKTQGISEGCEIMNLWVGEEDVGTMNGWDAPALWICRTWNPLFLFWLAARCFPPKSKEASHGGSCLATPQENNGVSVCPPNHQRFSAIPMATAMDPGRPLDWGVQADAHNYRDYMEVSVLPVCVHGGRASPRPVRGPVGWLKNDWPAVCLPGFVAGLGGGGRLPTGPA